MKVQMEFYHGKGAEDVIMVMVINYTLFWNHILFFLTLKWYRTELAWYTKEEVEGIQLGQV